MQPPPSAALVGYDFSVPNVFPPDLLGRLQELTRIASPPYTAEAFVADENALAQTDVIIGTWGLPVLDENLLARMPRLRAVFYAAGTVKGFVTDALWDRRILVVSAAAANAVPVAEYTIGAILLSLKRFFDSYEFTRSSRRFERLPDGPGNFRSTVGVISLGQIGRLVIEKLKVFDHRVIAYDPYAPPSLFSDLGVQSVNLEELFATADVVSLHAPWIPETVGMITGDLLRRMKPMATFINTSRGALVREPDLFQVLTERPDLSAIIDVTHPEPPLPDSPFFTLPNIRLTPHLAGSVGAECARMGWLVYDELNRWLSGLPLRHEVTRQRLALMA